MSADRRIPIVLVEDDEIDVEAVRRALRASDLDRGLRVYSDGDEALAAARGGSIPLPCFLVVDLNLPRLPGLELLEALREESLLERCEVAIFSTSFAASDRARALDLGVRDYFAKSDRSALGRLVAQIEGFARVFHLTES
jgi:DNA-binding response OmpR family regulator